MKEKIKKSLLVKNRKYKKQIKELNNEIVDLKEEIKMLKKINFEISSNNQFLIEQRKRYIKKNRQLRLLIEEIKLKEEK